MTEEKQRSDERPRRLVDLAAELGFNPSGFLKVVRRRGFEPFKIQDGRNKPYYLSADDADALRRKLDDEKKHRFVPDEEDVPTGLSGIYAIEVPAYDCSIRIKIGAQGANSVKHRMMLGYGAPKVERIPKRHGRARLTQLTAFASHVSPHERRLVGAKALPTD